MPGREYQQTIAYLFEQLPMYQRVGKEAFKKDLTNTRTLCRALDHPEETFRSVHIAGTNGKGSVSHLLAAPLQETGWSVGLYTSPHYRDFRERIKINGDLIPEEAVVAFVAEHKALFEEIKPSFFEITVVMAFWYFALEQVDIAVVETGLGGRLDSTNVLQPLLSVITNIGYDHMEMLGETLPEIAGEKAGIIKEGVPVLIGERQSEVEEAFIERARERQAEWYFAEDICTAERQGQSGRHQSLEVRCRPEIPKTILEVEALGSYQVKNARTALAALTLFKEYGFVDHFNTRHILASWRELRSKTGFMGRFQLIGHSPDILVDSAHNAEGLRAVLDDLSHLSFDALHIVLGLVQEKNPVDILSLFPRDARYYFARADIPRAMPVDRLTVVADELGLKGSAYPSVAEALETARHTAGAGDLIFVGGSTFTVAEVL